MFIIATELDWFYQYFKSTCLINHCLQSLTLVVGQQEGHPACKKWRDSGGRHWLVRMEWCPAGWSVYLPRLIFPCIIKSRSSLLAPAHPGGPGKRAVKRLWWWNGLTNLTCGVCGFIAIDCWTWWTAVVTSNYATSCHLLTLKLLLHKLMGLGLHPPLRRPKTLSFFVCLSVTLLNVRVCAPDFTMKAMEYRNDFDTVG